MRRFLIGSCAAVALSAGNTQAQPVEEVFVTGYLEEELPQQLATYGVRMQTVTADQLLNGGYNDVTQALQNQVPGLYLAPLSGPFDYVELSYQGSRRPDVLWLIDGVRINNRLYTLTSPLDTIPAHMVERIEVLDRGQGLFYGTTAVAGVINVVTKDFSATPDGIMGFGVSSGAGQHLNGYFCDSFGRHQIVIYGSKDQADGFQPFRDSDY